MAGARGPFAAYHTRQFRRQRGAPRGGGQRPLVGHCAQAGRGPGRPAVLPRLGGLLMKNSSQRQLERASGGERSRRLSRAVVFTSCFALIMAVAFALIMAVAFAGVGKQLHSKNRFFNPAAGRAQAPFPTVDQVLSLREVPVAEPMAVVWDPATQGPIPGPDTSLDFQPLSAEIVKDQAALIGLGKTLFWDMQVGSDGVLACASCHYSAGADVRDKNQISPNLSDANFKKNVAPNGSGLGGDNLFGNSTVPFTANDPNSPSPSEPPDPNSNRPGHPSFGPNYRVVADDFPLNDWFSPTELTPRGPGVTLFEEMSNVSRDTNDILASQGVRFTKVVAINPRSAVHSGTPLADI